MVAAGHAGAHSFSGTSEGQSTATVDGSAVVATTFDGEVRGTAIGKGSYDGNAEQHWYASFSPRPAPDCDGAGAWVTGDMEITAANGDTIAGSLGEDVATTDSYVCEVVQGVQYTTHLVVKVTGGTGRFAAATGTITSEGESHFSHALSATSGVYDDSAVLDGELTYTASSRGKGK